MSISSALIIASTGLGAVARGTEVVAANIANAATESYGRREMQTSASLYGGVRIDGIARMVNAGVLSELRLARADNGGAAVLANYHRTIEGTIGIPGEAHSISDRTAAFEGALVRATARPDSDIRLGEVLAAAVDLAAGIAHLGEAANTARQQADAAIARDVADLNAGLAEVARLNRAIIVEDANGRDSSSLQDARQRAIDALAQIVPLREVARDNGRVALFTTSGATLLDGPNPVAISFARTGSITPGMDVTAGDLARLVVDDKPLTAAQMAYFAGGSLSAHFQIRDELAPAMQAQADLMARDLAQRFGPGGPDGTLPAGAPGLFTDSGGPPDADPAPGFAQRLGINAAVDPAQGGALWHLRDGLAASTPGDSGDARLLEGLLAALRAPLPSGALLTGGAMRSVAGLAADLSGQASTARVRSEATLTHQAARQHALAQSLAGDGVDTDRELERLLTLEQAYAANARVIKAADTMLNTILGI